MTDGVDVTTTGAAKRFPKWVHDPGEWALHTRMLTREQRAILLDLYGEAWLAGPTQDTLAGCELDFPRVVGPDWRDHLPWLALYFLPVPGAEGMLRAPFLTAKLVVANDARAKLSRAGKKSAESRQQRAGANNGRRKPPKGKGLNIVQQPLLNTAQQGSEGSSRDALTSLSREEPGDAVAAAGRGVPTAAPPSPSPQAPSPPAGATPPPVASPARRAGAPVAIGAVRVAPPAAPAPLSRSAAAQLAGGGRVSRPALMAADSLGQDDPPRGAMERWVLEHAPEELEERLAAAQEAQPNAHPAALRMPAISQVYRRHHPTPTPREEALAR